MLNKSDRDNIIILLIAAGIKMFNIQRIKFIYFIIFGIRCLSKKSFFTESMPRNRLSISAI